MARQQGVVGSAAGLIPFGHLGWGYRDRTEFLRRAAEYMADGLAQNQWVEYVGAGSREQLRAELAVLPGITDVSDIKVTPAPEFYAVPAGRDVIDPRIAVDTRVAAIEKAIEHGYTGFRAVFDATAMTGRPEQRDAFAAFEFLIDQKMAVLPLSGLCAFDLNQLGDDAAGLICLHPFVGPGAPAFRVYAHPPDSFALAGQIDAAGDETFTTTLHRIWPLITSEEQVAINAQNLESIRHRQLLTLDHCARADGRRVVLQTNERIVTQLAGSLELTNVQLKPRRVSQNATPGRVTASSQPDTRDTRERLLDTALMLFARQGYAQTSIAEIQQACGLAAGSGALYKHFASKRELLETAVRRCMDRLAADPKPFDTEPPGDIEQALQRIATRVWDDIDNNAPLLRIIFREASLPDLADQLWSAITANVHQRFVDGLCTAIDAETIQITDPDAAVAVVLASLTHYQLVRLLIGHTPGGMAQERYRAAWIEQARAIIQAHRR